METSFLPNYVTTLNSGRLFVGFICMLAITCLSLLTVLTTLSHAGEDMTSNKPNERYERGMKALQALDAPAAQAVMDSLKDIAPDMARFIIEFAYGDVYARAALDPKSRQVATISALAALGNARPQLKFHIGAALNVGLTPDEIVECMYVTTVFAGFPSGLNGISTAREVFQARGVSVKKAGIQGQGNVPRRERGLKALALTSKDAGQRVIKSLSDITPDLADFIIDFAYGDIISRDVLSPKHKEVSMIAVCVAKGTMEPQMKVHINAAMNVGCSRPEIVELMTHMAVYAGFPAALNGLTACREVVKEIEAKGGKQ
jgi:4-carboxymuconolactone decarboxylase